MKDVKHSGLAVSLADNSLVLQVDDYLPMVPASLVKLVTSSLVLDEVGADYVLNTEFRFRGKIEGGVLYGDLVCVGSGDPTLCLKDLHPVVQALKRLNIYEIHGRVVIDQSAFSLSNFESVYTPAPILSKVPYDAAPFAFSFDQNCFTIEVKNGSGSFPEIRFSPDFLSFVQITVSKDMKDKSDSALLFKDERTDGVRLTLREGCKESLHVFKCGVRSGILLAADVLKEAFRRSGLIFSGKVELGSKRESHHLVSIEKMPIGVALNLCNTHSSNVATELLGFLSCGRKCGVVTQDDVLNLMSTHMEKATQQVRGNFFFQSASGFGLSNRLTAKGIVELLQYRARKHDFIAFKESLAVPGREGTLLKRFCDLSDELKNRISAKSGTFLSETLVSSLAGYYNCSVRGPIAFCFIANALSFCPQKDIEKLNKYIENLFFESLVRY